MEQFATALIFKMQSQSIIWLEIQCREGHPIKKPPADQIKKQTILLVEDEQVVRLVIRRYLDKQGYTVLEASDAREALTLCQQQVEQLDLLITDVFMPDINGPALAEKLLKLYPALPCLFISGYSGDELEAEYHQAPRQFLLQKPFSFKELIGKVEEILR